METTFPKMYDTESAAALLDLAPTTLQKFRIDMTGPNWVKLGNSVRYLEEDLLDWIKGQRQLPVTSKAATPEQLQAVMAEGHTERKAALAARQAQHAAMDHPKQDDGFKDFTKPAGMQQIINLPPIVVTEAEWLANSKARKGGA